jgi:RNA polymerase sigma-70 factor (ECF subfamily)
VSGRLERFRLARLVRRAQRGDARAFSSLFSTLHPVVYGYLAARVRVKADAEDLTAVTLHQFARQLPRYDSARGGVRAWVMTMARNVLIDHIRKTRRTDVAPLTDAEHLLADVRFSPDSGDIDPRLQQVQDALAEHPPTTREMFALRYGDGLTVAEIAAMLDMSEAAAKQRFSRTIRALKNKLDNPKEEEVAHAPS